MAETATRLSAALEEVLREVLRGEERELVRHEARQGCQPGDNFLGEIVRVSAVSVCARDGRDGGPEEEQGFIFKCPPASRAFREALQSHKFATNELAFYAQLVPRLDAFLRTASGQAGQLPVPRFLFGRAEGGDADVLVLEDLARRGFRMANRVAGLDAAHAALALRELGRLHAASLAMQHLHPDAFFHARQSIKETLYFEEGRAQFATIHLPCAAALRMLRARFPLRTDCLQQLEGLTAHFFGNVVRLLATPTPLAVLTHGDCWVNNMLFSYDPEDGLPDALRFLDFQLARFASLATDLAYLLYCSCRRPLLDAHWDTLLDAYLAALNAGLAQMGAAACRVSRGQLDAEMRRFARFGVAVAMQAVPFFVTPAAHQPRMEGGLEVFDRFHKNTHTNLLIRDTLTDVIVHAVDKGFLS